MKTATIIHQETVTQYFSNGVEYAPTPEEKLLNSIFNTLEIKTTTFEFELAEVAYSTNKDLDVKINAVLEGFKNFVHPNDVIIKTYTC
jgi:hypothetical protein